MRVKWVSVWGTCLIIQNHQIAILMKARPSKESIFYEVKTATESCSNQHPKYNHQEGDQNDKINIINHQPYCYKTLIGHIKMVI